MKVHLPAASPRCRARALTRPAHPLPPRPQHNDDTYVVKTYNRPPVVFTHGKGCILYDTDGALPPPALLAA